MFEERIEKLNGVSETPKKTTYSVAEIRQILGISRPTAYNLIKTNCFQSVRTGKGIRVIKSSFDAWVESQN